MSNLCVPLTVLFCVTLFMALHLFHLQNGDNGVHLLGLLWGSNKQTFYHALRIVMEHNVPATRQCYLINKTPLCLHRNLVEDRLLSLSCAWGNRQAGVSARTGHTASMWQPWNPEPLWSDSRLSSQCNIVLNGCRDAAKWFFWNRIILCFRQHCLSALKLLIQPTDWDISAEPLSQSIKADEEITS